MTDEELAQSTYRVQATLDAINDEYESFERFEKINELLVKFARSVAARARDEALEEAAKVAEARAAKQEGNGSVSAEIRHACRTVAAAVRALKGEEEGKR